MKKRFFIFFALSGLFLSSCNLSKCACNTFGSNENIKQGNSQQEVVSVSAEEKAIPRQ